MKGYRGLTRLWLLMTGIILTVDGGSVTIGSIHYTTYDTKATFDAAATQCSDITAQMVSFGTQVEYVAFEQQMRLDTDMEYWIGLKLDNGANKTFHAYSWPDGTKLNQTFQRETLMKINDGEDEHCIRMKYSNTWEWWDTKCDAKHPYICMQVQPVPPTPAPITTSLVPFMSSPSPAATKTTAPVVTDSSPSASANGERENASGEDDGSVPPSTEKTKSDTGTTTNNDNTMYIIIGASVGGVVLVAVVITVLVVLLRKRSSGDTTKTPTTSTNDQRAQHISNPKYENADVDDEAGAPGNRITTNVNGRVKSGNHYDSIDEDRQREVVYTDVDTGTKEQQGQGATYEDVSYYNNVQVTAKPPIRTDTVGYSEVGMPSQFLAGSGVGAPNVGAEGTPSSAHEDNVAELYAEVVKPQRNPAPKEEKKEEEEEEETDYYALAPAIPLKLL